MEISTVEDIASVNSEPKITCDTLNLLSYMDRYEGYTRLQRLLHILKKCSNLENVTIDLVFRELRRINNSALYNQVVDRYQLDKSSDLSQDAEWFSRNDIEISSRIHRIETELSVAKSSMIKESIRLGYTALGDFHYSLGNLEDALKSYIRLKEHCSLPIHSQAMTISICTVSILLGHYKYVGNVVSKIVLSEFDAVGKAKIIIASALTNLSEGKYKQAAIDFSKVQGDVGNQYSEIISPEDIALYGILCGFATMSRTDIRKTFFDNPLFRIFLELCPELRCLLNDYIDGNYGTTISYVQQYQNQLKLDIYLSDHIEMLTNSIIERAVLTYFKPFSVANMMKMSTTLQLELPVLENIIAKLIQSKKLNARMDSITNTLYVNQSNGKDVAINKVQELMSLHTFEVKRSLLRLSLMQHNFCITRDLNHNTSMLATESLDEDSNMEQGEIMQNGFIEEDYALILPTYKASSADMIICNAIVGSGEEKDSNLSISIIENNQGMEIE